MYRQNTKCQKQWFKWEKNKPKLIDERTNTLETNMFSLLLFSWLLIFGLVSVVGPSVPTPPLSSYVQQSGLHVQAGKYFWTKVDPPSPAGTEPRCGRQCWTDPDLTFPPELWGPELCASTRARTYRLLLNRTMENSQGTLSRGERALVLQERIERRLQMDCVQNVPSFIFLVEAEGSLCDD